MNRITVQIKNQRVFINGVRADKLDWRSRQVYTNGRWVVKFNDAHRFCQCEPEYRQFMQIKPDDLKMVVPLVAYHEDPDPFLSFVVQPFVNFKVWGSDLLDDKYDHERADVLLFCERYGIEEDNFNRGRNWGIRHNGTPALFDWGYDGSIDRGKRRRRLPDCRIVEPTFQCIYQQKLAA